MNPGHPDKQEHNDSDEYAAASRSDHDIRASIAITKGFNKALESSLSELSHALHQALDQYDADSQGEPITRIRELEEDCRFCVLRINRSLEQLHARLIASTRFEPQPTSHSKDGEP